MIRLVTRMTAFAAAFALFAGALPVAAQQSGSGVAQQEQPAHTDFSKEELESFAKASLEVERINEKWVAQIAEAKSEEEGKQMRDKAVEEMSSAIEDEGLTVDTYNSIFAAAESNPEIASRIKDYREEHR